MRPAMEARRIRVLVVKDSAAAREFSGLIEHAGHAVEIATSVTEAVARLTHLGFDVAILDRELRGEDTAPVRNRLERDGIPYVASSRMQAEYVDGAGVRSQFTPPFTAYRFLTLLRSIGD